MKKEKFVTITGNKNIIMRPFCAGDKAGETKDGRMRIHGSRELADIQMTKFWEARGFNARAWVAR